MDLELNNIYKRIVKELGKTITETFPYFSVNISVGNNINLINVRGSISESVIHKKWREKHDNRKDTN